MKKEMQINVKLMFSLKAIILEPVTLLVYFSASEKQKTKKYFKRK